MNLRFILPLLLSTSAWSMTVVPGILSEQEAEYYRDQEAFLTDSLLGHETVEVDATVAIRLRSALGGRRILEENTDAIIWDAPLSVFLQNPLNEKRNVKGATKGFHGENAGYITLEDYDTEYETIESGSLIVFEANEDTRDLFSKQTRVLGPLSVVSANEYHRILKHKSKKSKKSDKDPSDDVQAPTPRPTSSPTAAPTVSPTAGPTASPTISPVAETELYYGPCVCTYMRERGCTRCQGSGDAEDCQGDCPDL